MSGYGGTGICDFCGQCECRWENHSEARAEVEARAWESWDDNETQELSGWFA